MSEIEQNSGPVVESGQAPVQQEAPTTVEQPTVAENATVEQSSLLDLVSDEYKGLVDKKGFKDINDALKSYANLESMVGNSVRIPSADASPEARADFLSKIKDIPGVLIAPGEGEDKSEFYNKLGRPEDATGYNLSEVVDAELAAKIPNISTELEGFQEYAHELGLNKEQAAALVNMRMEQITAHEEQYMAQLQESENTLKQQWGNDYDNRINLAKNTAKIYAEKFPEQMQALLNGPTANNPAFINMLVELGSSFKEQGHAGVQNSNLGMSPEEAQSKIYEKRGDRGFMKKYTDSMAEGHAQAVQELERLYQIANQ